MVHKSKKLTAVYALIMDLPLSILITLISLVLAGNLAAPMFIRMAILAYVITFFVNFLPAPKWGLISPSSIRNRERSSSVYC